jgi:hypothetical protein
LRSIGAYLRRHQVALLALFFALGGTSYAASHLINGSQIKPHTIAKNRLTNGAIASLKGQRGVPGAPGPAGAQGPQGTQGERGPTGTRGPMGARGSTGSRGPTGSRGATGSRGPTGLQGVGLDRPGFALSTVDSAEGVGTDTSVTVGADGLGLVSYYDGTNADLKVAHCSNLACTSATLSTLDSAGSVGTSTSVTVGGDGLGLVSYYYGTNGDLKVAHLSNPFGIPYFRRR